MLNLTFVSKLVERVVSLKLTTFLIQRGLMPQHTTDITTQKQCYSRNFAAIDRQLTVLGLLDLSAAHPILLQ